APVCGIGRKRVAGAAAFVIGGNRDCAVNVCVGSTALWPARRYIQRASVCGECLQRRVLTRGARLQPGCAVSYGFNIAICPRRGGVVVLELGPVLISCRTFNLCPFFGRAVHL